MRPFAFGCWASVLAMGWPGAALAAPAPPPPITAKDLVQQFFPVMNYKINYKGWQLLASKALAARASEYLTAPPAAWEGQPQAGFFIPITPTTAKPVRLTEDPASRAFFRGIPSGQSRDGSLIGYKCLFYPSAFPVPGRPDAGPEPGIPFFLVQTAPADLTAADVSAPPSPAEEEAVNLHRLRGYTAFNAAMASKGAVGLGKRLARLGMAASYGNCQAQYTLGLHYSALDTPLARNQARHWFRLAADQGYPEAGAALAKSLALDELEPVEAEFEGGASLGTAAASQAPPAGGSAESAGEALAPLPSLERPRLLAILAAVLDQLGDPEAALVTDPERVTLFDMVAIPPFSPGAYLQSLAAKTPISDECLVQACIHILVLARRGRDLARVQAGLPVASLPSQRQDALLDSLPMATLTQGHATLPPPMLKPGSSEPFQVTRQNLYPLLLTSLIVGHKYWDDGAPGTGAWAWLVGRPVRELNRLEQAYLALLDYRLDLPEQAYHGFLAALAKAVPK